VLLPGENLMLTDAHESVEIATNITSTQHQNEVRQSMLRSNPAKSRTAAHATTKPCSRPLTSSWRLHRYPYFYRI